MMLSRSKGGTPIESWSSEAASAMCSPGTASPGTASTADSTADSTAPLGQYYVDEVTNARAPLPSSSAAAGGVGGRRTVGQESAGSVGSHYAAMINPLLSFPIKSAIWYQGEQNGKRKTEKRKRKTENGNGKKQYCLQEVHYEPLPAYHIYHIPLTICIAFVFVCYF